MRQRKPKEKKNTQEWLTTYSDLVTLLLCFFVLLFSFSNIDAQKFQSIMNALQGSLGVIEGGTTIVDAPEITTAEENEEEEFEKLKQTIEDYAEKEGLKDDISLDLEERGLVIRFMDSVFFDSGKADIKPESVEILHYIAQILNSENFKGKHIKVEGHTDTDPIIHSTTYPTNWELSAIRATNVLRFFVEEENINGDRISSSGYSFYRPIAPNDTRENKTKNRRVDIVILKSSYEKWEPN
jgi:chemotaxis protein MotB